MKRQGYPYNHLNMKGRTHNMKIIKKTIMFAIIMAMMLSIGYIKNHSAYADDYIDNPWKELLTDKESKTTNPEDSTAVTKEITKNGSKTKVDVAKVVIVKIAKKKKSAKKIRIIIKKVNNATGYQVRVYKKKALAKKNKKAICKKVIKKNIVKFVVKNKKLINQEKLFVKVRAYNSDAKGTKIFGAWSKVKKVKIK